MDDMLTLDEAAEELGVTTMTLRNWQRQNNGVTPCNQTTIKINTVMLDNTRFHIREEVGSPSWNASAWCCRRPR
jgi:predicted site-specific integrase-resolvase